MSKKATRSLDKDKARDPDFIKAEIAMQRAAQKAREKARRAGTKVAVFEDGKIVEEYPTKL